MNASTGERAGSLEPASLGRVWSNLAAVAGLFRGAVLGRALGYGALSLLAGVPAPAGAWLLARLINAASTGAPLRIQGWLAAGIAATAVVAAVLVPATRYLQGELGRRIGLRARGELMAAVNRLTGLDQIEQPVFADRLRLATQSGATAPQTLARTGFAALAAATTTAGFALALGTTAPWLAAVVVAGCVPAAVAAAADSRARTRLLWRASPSFRREMFYAELLTGRHAKEVRLFGIGDLLHRRMLTEGERIAAGERALERRASRIQAALATLAALTTGLAIGWAIVVIVALDESLVRAETIRLTSAIRERAIDVGAVVWNRAFAAPQPLPATVVARQFVADETQPPPIGARALRDWSRTWRNALPNS